MEGVNVAPVTALHSPVESGFFLPSAFHALTSRVFLFRVGDLLVVLVLESTESGIDTPTPSNRPKS